MTDQAPEFAVHTQRLTLRDWRDADREPWAAMGRDPEVMVHLGPLMDRTQADAAFNRLRRFQATLGHTFWALERRESGEFLGFCGLKIIPENITGLEDVVEIGWRLRRDAWGKGYAREAATASLQWGWDNLPVDRIAAITTPANSRSWGLMQRLGMTRRHDLDFHHPALAPDDPLAPHIAYEIFRPGPRS
jgi:RimJ/RimL family protein N-acetyltransferase